MTKKTSNRFSPEVRQRAVRMVLEHGGDHASQWAAIGSIAAKIGCTAETLRKWVRQAERDAGQRPNTESADQNPWAQSRRQMDVMVQGCSTSLFQAWQQWSTISS
jgi:transposase-like protein